ncbi:Olfactory receptor 7G2 [Sciurus carolinensis]|uniref:Olfactory receptor 7G2 n=1 Tax=Sciurus carolinensis TaxID=30640 RepID=A0AA41T7F9_SCICA|nr:Olfactory receptor 7G2 [Sciurus carolinensis]
MLLKLVQTLIHSIFPSDSSPTQELETKTDVSQFHLLGLTEDPALQPLTVSLFLSMYLVTILGNMVIILAIFSESHPHPQFVLGWYLFKKTTIPKMFVNTEAQDERIICSG